MSNQSSSGSPSSELFPSFTSGPAPSYPQELDIPGATAPRTSDALMSYSVSFTSNWKKELGTGTGGQGKNGAWSTKAHAGSRS
ncbi:hypothetical protein SAMD00023353_9400060 [Rosellinia necatrix]|uniref:Uncharacterized protein n=1 Tax=Rosellinia necatrix TaxID=77044 RepID=A0A1W2TVW4_ROSNE|nr:hypothetical protein SAMD00023353_9400060 [Rosellinia necatrix]